MEISEIKKDKEYTVVQQAMDQIKNLIITGKYKTGDKLPTEMELASQFGISRSSLREAIKLFNYLGILESRVAKGTFVSDTSGIASELISMSALLGDRNTFYLLEYYVAEEAWYSIKLAENYKKDPARYESYIKDLERALNKLHLACSINNIASINTCVHRIHSIFAESSENPVMKSSVKSMLLFASSLGVTVQKNMFSMDIVTYNLYSLWIEAIKNNDTATIYKAASDYVEICRDRIEQPLPPVMEK